MSQPPTDKAAATTPTAAYLKAVYGVGENLLEAAKQYVGSRNDRREGGVTTNRGTYMGRHVCTAADPYDPDKHGTHSAHPDAKKVGGSYDGACDDFACPNCGTEWRDCYDDN